MSREPVCELCGAELPEADRLAWEGRSGWHDPRIDTLWRYKQVRNGLRVGPACDFDSVEYEVDAHTARPVAFLELTLCDAGNLDAPGLLSGIWARLDPDGHGASWQQAHLQRASARLWGVPAYIVVHDLRHDRFAVKRYDCDPPSTWKSGGLDTYARWLARLHDGRRPGV